MANNRAFGDRGADVWAGEMGDKWLRYIEQFEGMIGPVGEGVLKAGAFKPGEKVIDIGCGGGATSINIARQVGMQGHVRGLDISKKLLALAEQRAAAAGVGNVQFMLGDASRTALNGENFDCLFSRFGVMFFPDSYGAFAHMKGFLRPGGRLVFACWAPVTENTWAMELRRVAERHVEVPKSEPRTPGPFAFGEPEYVEDILTKAGFGNISITPWRGDIMMGRANATPEEAAQFAFDALFIGELMADEPEEAKARALADVENTMSEFLTDKGVALPASAWFVEASA